MVVFNDWLLVQKAKDRETYNAFLQIRRLPLVVLLFLAIFVPIKHKFALSVVMLVCIHK